MFHELPYGVAELRVIVDPLLQLWCGLGKENRRQNPQGHGGQQRYGDAEPAKAKKEQAECSINATLCKHSQYGLIVTCVHTQKGSLSTVIIA
ncbi:MAG: hypothetical protein WA970_12120 [Gammaproteobacteria bacterium]